MSYQQGGGEISDTALHTGLDSDIVEILADGTGFDTVLMQTKTTDTLLFAAAAEMVSSGGAPNFKATGHVKGELIRMRYNEQRVTAIKLNSGSVRHYNSGS